RFLVARRQFSPHLIIVNFFWIHFLSRLTQLLGTHPQPTPTGMFSEHFDRTFGVVARWQRMLRSRERVLSATVNKSAPKFLRLLFGFGDKGWNEIAEILRTGLIAVLRRFISIDIPQIAGWPESGSKTNVGVFMLSAPAHGFRAQHPRNPHRRMGFLVR